MKHLSMILAGLALLLAISACDQSQPQAMNLREEYQRKLDSKDRELQDANRRVSELDMQRQRLEDQKNKAMEDAEAAKKLASDIGPVVSKALEPLVAEVGSLKKDVEQLHQQVQQAMTTAAQNPQGLAGGGGNAPAPQPKSEPIPTPKNPTVTDPNRKTYKFDFGR